MLKNYMMLMTTISGRQFNQDASGAKRAAKDGPVFITNRGRPAHMLLSIEAYRRITGEEVGIPDLLADPAADDVPFNPPQAGDLFQLADLG